MSPLIDRYTRRLLPAGSDPQGFWTTELQNIQRAIDAARAGGVVLTPGVYGDPTHTVQVTVDADGHITGMTEVPIAAGGGGVTTFRTSDVSTTGTGYGSSVSTGLTQAIAVGETWHLRWTLYIRRPGGGTTGGVSLWLTTAPVASSVHASVLAYGNSAGMNPMFFAALPSGTPAALVVGVGTNPNPSSAGAVPCVVELFIRNVTGASTVDVHFAPEVAGETAVVQDGSFLVAERVS